jgi:hypothetical protein
VAAALVVLGTMPLEAMQRPDARAQEPKPGPRDEVVKMVDAYIMSSLQDRLGLSDEQFAKVVPLLTRLQKDRRIYAQRRHELLKEMRQLLETGHATEARITELMADMHKLEIDQPATLRKDTEAIDSNLTSTQQAKLRVLEMQVEQRIRDLVGARRQQRLGRGRPGLPSDPE